MTVPSYRSIDIEPNVEEEDDDDRNYEDSLWNDDDDEDDDVLPSQSSIVPARHPLSATAAALALWKGNLGPGVLNLPHAFARAGPTLGAALFLVVALQGLYSMTLLVACKQWINASYTSRHGERGGPHIATTPVQTFMDVTQFALGPAGGRLTEGLVVLLQLGVCCVFLSLLATNVQAAVPWLSSAATLTGLAATMMGAVLLRFLQDLFYLNAMANAFMLLAIGTATIASLLHILQRDSRDSGGDADYAAATTNTTTTQLSAAVSFTADMFFAFEGIGLVLPVENQYDPPAWHATHLHTTKRWRFETVLLVSMTGVAVLFALTGLTAGLAFPDSTSASVTAFLRQRYPHVLWYSIVNALVVVAVAMTFPLQLTPAMEVLEQWSAQVRRPGAWHRSSSDDDDDPERHHPSHAPPPHHGSSATTVRASLWHSYGWILRRWGVVGTCAAFVYAVDDLGLLVGLVGAVGQTGLAALPCAVHLVLQRRRVAPPHRLYTLLDVAILLFCTGVMISGCYLSITDIVHKKRR